MSLKPHTNNAWPDTVPHHDAHGTMDGGYTTWTSPVLDRPMDLDELVEVVNAKNATDLRIYLEIPDDVLAHAPKTFKEGGAKDGIVDRTYWLLPYLVRDDALEAFNTAWADGLREQSPKNLIIHKVGGGSASITTDDPRFARHTLCEFAGDVASVLEVQGLSCREERLAHNQEIG